MFELTAGTEDCPIEGEFVLASEGQTSCSGPLTGLALVVLLKTNYVAGVAKTLLVVDILLL